MTDYADYNTVETRLLRCDSDHADLLLQVYVEDSLGTDSLTYEDLVQPLKTTGGHLSIEVTFPDEQRTFVRYVPPGYLEVVEPENEVPPTTIPPHDLKRWLRHPDYEMAVVPVEDTPFVGGGDT